jgi:hypothetical protein
MAGERTFVVKFVTDIGDATTGIGKMAKSFSGLSGQLEKGVGSALKNLIPSFKTMAIAGTAAAGAVAAASFKLVQQASNLEESQSKVNTVFGNSAFIIDNFAKTSASSFGITKQAALEASGTFGNLIQAFGIGEGQAANMSITLVQLAADLASFNNTSIEDAIIALRSGLSGETEPLKRFGVAINDVRLKEEARTLGLYSGKGALDITAKTQAAYALILKDTNLAQGDFARTSEGFANQMRILQASLSDAATEVGMVLLPYFKEFVSFINDNIVPAITAFADNLGEEGVGRAFEFAIAAMGDFGIKAIEVMKGAYIATLEFLRSLADVIEKLGQVGVIASAASFNAVGAFKSLAVGVTASNIGDRIDEQLAGADQLFLDLANGVRSARLELDALKFASNRTTEQQVRNAERVGKVIRTGIKEEEDKDKATTGAAKAVETAKQKLEKYTDAMRASTKASKAFTNAQKDSKKANEAKAQADADLATAEANLAQITAGFGAGSPQAKAAALALDQAQRGVERAGYRIEQSTFAVTDAELELAKVRKDPESSLQAIREAEIALAEAKLALKDATDDQSDATGELKDQQQLLNEAVSGATDGSKAYEEALLAVNDAKKKQAEANERVADSIEREAEAQERLNDAEEKRGELAKLYPKIAANNPMAPFAGSVPSTVTGNAGGATFADNPGQMNVTINAGLGASGVQIGQELNDYLSDYLRLNGGSIGNFVGVR